MQDSTHWRSQPKDGASRFLNRETQPERSFRVFNQPRPLTSSWYSVLPTKKLRKGKAVSVTIGDQRVALFRGESGRVYCTDSFCPHFGADLANGKVTGENIQCYFHQWEFSGKTGNLEKTPASERLPNCPKLNTYPVIEKWGMLWVYPSREKPKPFPFPDVDGERFAKIGLFVHHHALMMSAIDLHHFFSVHNLDIDFRFHTEELSEGHFLWQIEGEIPADGWLARMGRVFLGKTFKYEVEFFGGTLLLIRYGVGARLFGSLNGLKIPSVQMAWSSMANEKGISDSDLFIVYPKFKGLFSGPKRWAYKFFSVLVLWALKDDDVKAYPHMKFNPQVFIDKDRASVEFIKQIESLEECSWS